ncbi:hypothetical protein F5148DRAFT_642545 [Russula earlei]|uniref:Uncharacterized protein n=1 Tax=Russula earlei TaxID=71964 RepID=A0ACC0TUH3_9AGAM|nr:hypothetical protein F5148DRAFT_642545 [Russula earlei]
MSRSITHVGLALFHTPTFPTQWVLAFSTHELFQERVMCRALRQSVNGLNEYWETCESSPTSFNRSAILGGVIHIGIVYMSMEDLLKEFSAKGTVVSETYLPSHSDRFCVQSLLRLSKGRAVLPTTDEFKLMDLIRGRVSQVEASQASRAFKSYPVVELKDGGIRMANSAY